MNFKRILCLALALLFCTVALMGCKKDEQTDPANTTGSNSNNTPSGSSDTEDPSVKDTLGTYNFDGKEFRILTRATTEYEFDSTSTENAEAVNSAIYSRDTQCKNRLNINFKVDDTPGAWDDLIAFANKYMSIAITDFSEYELVSGHAALIQDSAVQGCTADIARLPEINMSKKWWSEDFYKANNIGGKLYTVIGDVTYTLYQYMEVVFFNETVAESYVKDASGNAIDLYALVESGEWTYDKFKQYTLAVTANKTSQTYGLLMNGHSLRTFTTAFDCSIASYDEATGKYSFPANPPSKTVTVFEDLLDFIWDSTEVYYENDIGSDAENANPIFNRGKTLFYTQILGEAKQIVSGLDEKSSFGILPFPKYDSDQLEYYTTCCEDLSALSIPKNVGDAAFAGAVTEALAMYSYRTLRPAYYETVLKKHYLGNPKLAAMLDDIRDSLTVQFDMAFSYNLGFPFSATTAMDSDTSYTDYYARQYKVYSDKLQKIYDALS